MLIDLIREHALQSAESGDFAAVAAILNAIRKTITDETHWTFGLMSQGRLPTELVTGIASAVKSAAQVNPLMESAFIAFSTTGLQLHTTERQSMIDSIGVGLPGEAVAAMKSLGVRSVPVASTTATDCESAWQADLAAAAAQQAAAIRASRIASVERLDAVAIVDSADSLDDAINAIHSSLTAFGGW